MKTKITAVLLVVLIITAFAYGGHTIASAAEKKGETVGYVFIGDSRFVGMNQICGIDTVENYYVIAKSAKGYNWFMLEGSEELLKIRTSNNYDRWVYIFNLGVNDLYQVDRYVEVIKELEREATVYFVSVNPTIDSKSNVKCAEIEKFNNKIKENCANYIDCYSYLTDIGFEAGDGVHFSVDTNKKIYEFIMISVDFREFVQENKEKSPNIVSYITTE